MSYHHESMLSKHYDGTEGDACILHSKQGKSIINVSNLMSFCISRSDDQMRYQVSVLLLLSSTTRKLRG